MVVTITSTTGIALQQGEATIRTIILAALGCNTAWGIVDGVMYVFMELSRRNRYAGLVSSLRAGMKMETALEAIEDELEFTIMSTLDKSEREHIAMEVLKSTSKATAQQAKILTDDVLGAVASFLLVFFAALPVVIPFFIVQNANIAIRMSNAIAIVMLFVIGHKWAQYTGRNRLRSGITMVLIGAIIIAVTVALGG